MIYRAEERGLRTEPRSRVGLTQSSVLAPQSSKGFTLIELVIVIIIISVLMGLFMNRVMFYREQAEKVAMQEVAGAIQSALVLQYGQILTRGKPSDVAALADSNPMSFLQKKPSNYAGEFYAPTLLSAGAGNWVFDLKNRELVYLVGNAEHFKPGADGQKWVRFRVTAHHEPSLLPSQRDAAPELTGLLFEPVEPYKWF